MSKNQQAQCCQKVLNLLRICLKRKSLNLLQNYLKLLQSSSLNLNVPRILRIYSRFQVVIFWRWWSKKLYFMYQYLRPGVQIFGIFEPQCEVLLSFHFSRRFHSRFHTFGAPVSWFQKSVKYFYIQPCILYILIAF